jgi:hypothetical protein
MAIRRSSKGFLGIDLRRVGGPTGIAESSQRMSQTGFTSAELPGDG